MAAFTTEEYRRRLAAIRREMSAAGVDTLVVLSESNMCYLTGYEGYSDYVPQAAVIFQDQDPALLLREMDIPCATMTSWLPHSQLIGYSERFIGTSAASGWQPIAEFIHSRSRSRRIGVEFSAKGFGVKENGLFLKALGLEAMLDGDGLVSRCKAVKSDAEIACMREAAEIVDQAMREGAAAIRPGVREAEVAAVIMHRLCAGTARSPGNAPRPPTMPVGKICNAPHIKWGDGVYEPGHQTNFEFGAFRHRYCCALSRSVVLGEPPKRTRELHTAVRTGFEAALAAVRPGIVCADVMNAFQKAFKPFGIRKESRIGYSIGIDWADGGASLQSDSRTPVVPNMTLHIIVGIWEPSEGYVLSETVQVTEKGGMSLSTMPRDLIVQPA